MLALTLVVGTLAACAGGKERGVERGKADPRSLMQLDRYLEQAVGETHQGVVVMSTERSNWELDRPRLNEIAQEMKEPLTTCFLRRAMTTMQRGEVDGELGWLGVPDGQIQVRARLVQDGSVLRADVYKSAFDDDEMEKCVVEVIRKIKFPEVRQNRPAWIDVYHWVSLGMDAAAHTPTMEAALRRQTALAAARGRHCLEGRTSAGTYAIRGLNLVGSEGGTLINRVESTGLPAEVGQCLVTALRKVELHPDRDSFVRPVETSFEYVVTDDAVITFTDERWLELLLLEEEAEAEARRAELEAGVDAQGRPLRPSTRVSDRGTSVEGAGGGDEASGSDGDEDARDTNQADTEGAARAGAAVKKGAEKAPPASGGPVKGPGHAVDPGKAGLKLDLGSRPH